MTNANNVSLSCKLPVRLGSPGDRRELRWIFSGEEFMRTPLCLTFQNYQQMGWRVLMRISPAISQLSPGTHRVSCPAPLKVVRRMVSISLDDQIFVEMFAARFSQSARWRVLSNRRAFSNAKAAWLTTDSIKASSSDPTGLVGSGSRVKIPIC